MEIQGMWYRYRCGYLVLDVGERGLQLAGEGQTLCRALLQLPPAVLQRLLLDRELLHQIPVLCCHLLHPPVGQSQPNYPSPTGQLQPNYPSPVGQLQS